MRLRQNLTSTQRGKIAELHVATALMSQSGGRLSPFEPMSDDHGIDLVVYDKQSGRTLPIQVKSWLLDPEKPVKTVQFDVQKTTFSKVKSGALICVVMDMGTLAINMAWVIPMTDIPTVATDRPGKYVLAPSRLATKLFRFKYRVDGKEGLLSFGNLCVRLKRSGVEHPTIDYFVKLADPTILHFMRMLFFSIANVTKHMNATTMALLREYDFWSLIKAEWEVGDKINNPDYIQAEN